MAAYPSYTFTNLVAQNPPIDVPNDVKVVGLLNLRL